MKKAAEWFYSTVFRDEAIRPKAAPEKLPALLRTARSLENGTGSWQSRESIFIKQAKLLAAYEDDYDFHGSVTRYYPTYQSLTDQELRGYFSWRTKLRRGDVQKTSLSFAFLYIYELLNQIGVADPLEGYDRLRAFGDSYGQLDSSILSYLGSWLTDYVIYYGLDPALLADSPQVVFDRCLTILEHVQEQDTDKVMFAVKQLSTKWLDRSKFYKSHRADCDTVIVRVLRRVSDHYATRCKKGFVEQYFGPCREYQVRLFDAAVFFDQSKKRNREFVLDERCVYRCKNGLWAVWKQESARQANTKLGDLLKTIDSIMREEYGYGSPVKAPLDTKWMLKIIREETRALLSQQAAAEAQRKAAEEKKITIDYAKLAKIRRDAAITQEKLTVEEEEPEEIPNPPAPVEYEEAPSFLPPEPSETGDTPLSPAEYRLLQCLLYAQDLRWIKAEGHMLSVLVDSINEKLYDEFMDSVLDDTPALIDDYIDELKEMVKP